MNPIYSVVIGTEILNGRRIDKHFPFLINALKTKNRTLSGNIVIADDPKQMEKVFNYVKNENAYLFCFGGIGATPDDYTRAVAAKVFTNKALVPHHDAVALICNHFGKDATSERLRMAELPIKSTLLHNPINNIPGFALEDKYFFMPGFPQMSHPMALEAINLFISSSKEKLNTWLVFVYSPESVLIPLMESLPSEINLSSLPHLSRSSKPYVEIELSSNNLEKLKEAVYFFENDLNKLNIAYKTQGDLNGY